MRRLIRTNRSTSFTSRSRWLRDFLLRCMAWGVPVVIGPLNGGMEYPAGFSPRRAMDRPSGDRGSWSIRKFGEWTCCPARRLADVVLVANERTRLALPSGIRGRVIEMVENGIDFGVWQGTSVNVESRDRSLCLPWAPGGLEGCGRRDPGAEGGSTRPSLKSLATVQCWKCGENWLES